MMTNEPVTLEAYALNKDALRAQEYLKNKGIESFIIMEGNWSGGGDTHEAHQHIRLVARPQDAELAIKLLSVQPVEDRAESLSEYDQKSNPQGFFRKAGWMVGVLFVFYFVGSFRDGAIDGFEVVPAGIFLIATVLLFLLASLLGRNNPDLIP